MAWRSSGTSNEDLVNQLWKNGLITDERVKEAFLKVCVSYINLNRLHLPRCMSDSPTRLLSLIPSFSRTDMN